MPTVDERLPEAPEFNEDRPEVPLRPRRSGQPMLDKRSGYSVQPTQLALRAQSIAVRPNSGHVWVYDDAGKPLAHYLNAGLARRGLAEAGVDVRRVQVSGNLRALSNKDWPAGGPKTVATVQRETHALGEVREGIEGEGVQGDRAVRQQSRGAVRNPVVNPGQ